jgi:hypothetical protein
MKICIFNELSSKPQSFIIYLYEKLCVVARYFTTTFIKLPDIDVKSEMVLPIVKCLRHLVHHNPATRESLAANTELYASLLRIIGKLV